MKTLHLIFAIGLALSGLAASAQVAKPPPIDRKSETITVKTVVVLVRIEVETDGPQPVIVGHYQTRHVTEAGVQLGIVTNTYVRRPLAGIVTERSGVQAAVDALTTFLEAKLVEDEAVPPPVANPPAVRAGEAEIRAKAK